MRRPGALALAARSDDVLFQFARRHGESDRGALRTRNRAIAALAAREPPTYTDVAHARGSIRSLRPTRRRARDDEAATCARTRAHCQRVAGALSGAREPSGRALHRRADRRRPTGVA